MLVSNQIRGDTLYVTLQGELDHHTSESVRAALDKLLKNVAVRNLVADLSGVNFMDSSGIGVLLGRYKIVQKRGGTMSVSRPKSSVDRILGMSGIYRVMRRL